MPQFAICTSYLFITLGWKFLSLLYHLTLMHPYLVNWFWFPYCSLCTLVRLLTLISVIGMRSSSAPDFSILIDWSVRDMTSPTNTRDGLHITHFSSRNWWLKIWMSWCRWRTTLIIPRKWPASKRGWQVRSGEGNVRRRIRRWRCKERQSGGEDQLMHCKWSESKDDRTRTIHS